MVPIGYKSTKKINNVCSSNYFYFYHFMMEKVPFGRHFFEKKHFFLPIEQLQAKLPSKIER
jgi:hypothetical protein